MVEFTLEQVVNIVKGKVLKEKSKRFKAVLTDTRKVTPESLFIALAGENFDGHDFCLQAIENGATGLIVSREYSSMELNQLNATIIKVEDTLMAYQKIANAHRKHFNIPVIAITGSNGKTTTKDITAAILGAKWNVLKTQANYNNEIGLPLTLLQLDEKHDAAVVEMGMRGFGQIEQLAKIAEPTIGIITNVGETHMELLGSVENIAKAKSELIDSIPSSGVVVLNYDNPYVKNMVEKVKGKVITFGLDKNADICATNIICNDLNSSFDCIYLGKTYKLQLPMLGKHNIYNALAAIAVGVYLGLTINEVQQGLNDLSVTKMRLEISQMGAYKIINDAYNASPASMQAAIETLSEITDNRKIAVLGDMLELGDIAIEAHRNVGKSLAEKKVDIVITLGHLGKEIANAAKENGIEQVYACNSHEEAARILKNVLAESDTILFKGSRGMKMEKIIDFM